MRWRALLVKMIFRLQSPLKILRSGQQSTTLRNPAQWLFEAFGAWKSKSGVAVTEENSLALSAVHRAVAIISETLSRLPVSILYIEADGDRIIQANHPANFLLNVRANSYLNSYNFDRLMYTYRALWGNAYAYIKRDDKMRPMELIDLYPWCCQPYRLADGSIEYFNSDPRYPHVPRWIKPHDIFHLKGISIDGMSGKSPIRLHAESIGINIAAEQYGGNWFGNSATPAGFLKTPAVLKPDQQKLMEQSWFESYGGPNNQNKVAVLGGGAEFVRISVPPEEAQFLESRKYGNLDIARIFGIPPHMLADLDRATFSNIEEQNLQFVSQTLKPYAEEYEQEVRSKLLYDSEALNHEVRHDFSELLKPNAQVFAEYLSKLVNNGFISINEGRHMLGQNSVDGGDQRYINAANMPIDLIKDFYQAQINAKGPAQVRNIGFSKEQFKQLESIMLNQNTND